MKNVSWISDLKIRGGYGIMGNQINVTPSNQFVAYGFDRTSSFYSINGAATTSKGFIRTQLGNPAAKWESNVNSNIGVDATLFKGALEFTVDYYQKEVKVKIQPFYFPFTEPSFEFAAECIFCDGQGCGICSQTGWIELGGCGMIHPNVLKMADIDPDKYTGFAWGFGIERLVMLKYNIEDVRHFESAKLDFLRQF